MFDGTFTKAMQKIEDRFIKIDERFIEMDKRFMKLEGKIDFVFETLNSKIDRNFAIHEQSIHELSVITANSFQRMEERLKRIERPMGSTSVLKVRK